MDYTERLVSFEEAAQDFPEAVFKYRTWSTPLHRTIIDSRTVYLAKPTDFEDKLDCKLFKRYDLITEKEIYERYLQSSKERHPS